MDEHAERSTQSGCKEARAPYGHLTALDAFDLIPQERHVILKNARPPDAGNARYPSDGKEDLTFINGDKFSFVLSFGRHVKLAEAERTRDGQTNPDLGSGRRNGGQRNIAETPGKHYQQCRYARVLQSRRGHRPSLSSTRRPCQPEFSPMRTEHERVATVGDPTQPTATSSTVHPPDAGPLVHCQGTLASIQGRAWPELFSCRLTGLSAAMATGVASPHTMVLNAPPAAQLTRVVAGACTSPDHITHYYTTSYIIPKGAEAGGLEPPRAFARRISSAVPYQLDYASGRTGSIGLGMEIFCYHSRQSGRPDLNRGPLRPERSALPD